MLGPVVLFLFVLAVFYAALGADGDDVAISTDREDWTDVSAGELVGLSVLLGVLALVLTFLAGATLFLFPVLAASAVGLLVDGYRRWQQLRLVEDTATEPVRSVAVGRTEVYGTAEPVDEPVDRPFGEGECVAAFWEVEEYDDDGGWETLASGVRRTPFVIDDGTGAIRVEPPADPTTRMTDGNETERRLGPLGLLGPRWEPEPVRSFLAERDDVAMPDSGLVFRPQRRYTETVIPSGEAVYVLGGAEVREDAAGSNPERLVLTRDEASGEFVVADRPQAAFVAEERSWARTEVALGVALLAATLGMMVLQFGAT